MKTLAYVLRHWVEVAVLIIIIACAICAVLFVIDFTGDTVKSKAVEIDPPHGGHK